MDGSRERGEGEASGGIHQTRMLTLLTVAFMTSLARTFITLNAIYASRRRTEESVTLGASERLVPSRHLFCEIPHRHPSSLNSHMLRLQPKKYTYKGIISRHHLDRQVQMLSTNTAPLNTSCTKLYYGSINFLTLLGTFFNEN